MATTARLPEQRNQRHCSIAQFFNNVSHGYGEAELRFWLIHILETRKRRWHVSQIRLSGIGVIKVVRRLKSKVVRILLRMRGRDLRQIVMCEMPFRPNIAVKQLLIILALHIVPPSYTFIGYGSISHRLSGIFEEVNEILSPEAAEAAYRNDRWTNQIQRNSEVPIEIFFVNRDSSYKELSPTQEQQQQESNTKLQNQQKPNDLSSQGFRQPETNPTVQIQDKPVNNTSAKFQLNQRRSHRRIYQTLKTALLKNCDDQLH
ncbi:hypothetical protein F2Q69_00035749 [Brassica cretica]|uniref:Uncharacterized protein n=1 Tax=Brassica cretica TaxID=69181 RepID=A0A8S9SP07_BRACR|nr:hypothetical protein F2Q69_00035749 [Brassica cretica]